jgi:hypothetical protein
MPIKFNILFNIIWRCFFADLEDNFYIKVTTKILVKNSHVFNELLSAIKSFSEKEMQNSTHKIYLSISINLNRLHQCL